MCGILILKGSAASKRIKSTLELIKHRGPDDTRIWEQGGISIGFNRLAINDQTSTGGQPFIFNEYVGVFNGEIFNHEELRERHQLNNLSQSDMGVILPLFSKNKQDLLSELDGFYSGVIYDKNAGNFFLIRDYIGKKPLFFGKSGDDYFITSELKALNHICWFKEAPSGLSLVDFKAHKAKIIEKHTSPKPSDNLYNVLEKAVKKRIPSQNLKFGVFLSGGLDSSIITALVHKYRKDTIYFILGTESSPDAQMANEVINKYALSNICRVPLVRENELEELLRKVVYYTESFNPSIVSNGLATYILAKAANEKGVKVVLSGEGADELFGGYHYNLNAKQWNEINNNLVRDMHFTELRRLDLCSMAHSVEVRCPFLDKKVKSIADSINIKDVFQPDMNKVFLRNIFSPILPHKVAFRKKTSFDVGSGIRKMLVEFLTKNGRTEKQVLYDIWRELFPYKKVVPYYHSYPVFNEVISKRGIIHR